MANPLLAALFAAAALAKPVTEVRFQASPFAELCPKSLFVSQSEYDANRETLEQFEADCGSFAHVETLPEGGWFSAVKARITMKDGDPRFSEGAAGFLREVGRRARDRIERNNAVSETLLACLRKDEAWLGANEAKVLAAIPAYTGCATLLASIRDRVKTDGPRYRIAREVVRNEARAFSTMVRDVKLALGIGFAGEKRLASPDEYQAALRIVNDDLDVTGRQFSAAVKAVDERLTAIDAKHFPRIEELRKTKDSFDPELQAEIASLRSERGAAMEPWYAGSSCMQSPSAETRASCVASLTPSSPYAVARLGRRTNELSEILASTPVLAYLGTDTPADAALEAAVKKVLANGRAQASRVSALLADGRFRDEFGNAYGTESTRQSVNRRLELLRFSPVLLETLAASPEHCGAATALFRYVQGLESAKRGARNTATAAAILLPLTGWSLAGAAGTLNLSAGTYRAVSATALATTAAGNAAGWVASGMWYLSAGESLLDYRNETQKLMSSVAGGERLTDPRDWDKARELAEQNVAWLALGAAVTLSKYTAAEPPHPTAEQLKAIRANGDTIAIPMAELEAGQLYVGKDQVVDNILARMVPAARKNPGGLLAEDLAMLNKKSVPVSISRGGRAAVLEDGHHFVSTQLYLQTTPYDEFPPAIRSVFSREDQLVLRAKGQFVLASPANGIWYNHSDEQVFDLLKNDRVYIDPKVRPAGFSEALQSLKNGEELSVAQREILREGYSYRPLVSGLGNDPMRSAVGMAYITQGGPGINADYQADFAQFLVANHPGFREELVAKGFDPGAYSDGLVGAVRAQLAEERWTTFMKSIPRAGADAKGVPFEKLNSSSIDEAMKTFRGN